ncbi:hypothetical protein [Rubritalea tangerina]|uniref:hypothetical protein n=1 Tax=Rubritalea tangerina TaxID=430798 RepID=UPI003622B95C
MRQSEWTHGQNELAEYQGGVKESRTRGTTESQRSYYLRSSDLLKKHVAQVSKDLTTLHPSIPSREMG